MPQELLETIERYFDGSMSIEERLTFEERVQNDAVFKSQVEDVKALLLGVETQALREQLDDFHKALPTQNSTKKKAFKIRQFRFMKIAAVAVIVIAVGSFWFLNGDSNDRLYGTYFKPDPGLPTTMSSSDNFAFFDAMVNYKQGEYQKAITKWELLHEKAPTNDTINYFIGVAYLADDAENEAIPYLESVTDSKNEGFKNEAHYYLGLAYLKKKNLKEAKQNLELSSVETAKTVLSKIKD